MSKDQLSEGENYYKVVFTARFTKQTICKVKNDNKVKTNCSLYVLPYCCDVMCVYVREVGLGRPCTSLQLGWQFHCILTCWKLLFSELWGQWLNKSSLKCRVKNIFGFIDWILKVSWSQWAYRFNFFLCTQKQTALCDIILYIWVSIFCMSWACQLLCHLIFFPSICLTWYDIIWVI